MSHAKLIEESTDLTSESKLKLVHHLDRACIRYLVVRIEFYQDKQEGKNLSEIDATRTRSHDALIACFNAILRQTQDPDVARASVNRIEIGKWGMRRALVLLNGSKATGYL